MSTTKRKGTGRAQTLALIPARGGSRAIPKKNIYPVGGKPLLAYSIEAAQKTPNISRVVVSTDSFEIEAVARRWNAEVISRPDGISGDVATSESALLHALDYLRATEDYEPEVVVFLQPTSPLRHPQDIQGALEVFRSQKADSLFSASPVHGFVWRNQDGVLASITYDYKDRKRRQESPEDLIENGSIYVFKPWVLRSLNNRLGGKIAVFRMDALNSFQVDEPDDLALIERLIAVRQSKEEWSRLIGIRLLVLDFDGVMTDNRVLVDEDGKEAAWCNRGDGWGIARLREAGVEIIVLSTEVVPVATARCRKLGIECIQPCENKLAKLKELVQMRALNPEHVAYVGNDQNDLECMRWVGVPIAVADATAEATSAAMYVTVRPGGYGAVREVADQILGLIEHGQD